MIIIEISYLHSYQHCPSYQTDQFLVACFVVGVDSAAAVVVAAVVVAVAAEYFAWLPAFLVGPAWLVWCWPSDLVGSVDWGLVDPAVVADFDFAAAVVGEQSVV